MRYYVFAEDGNKYGPAEVSLLNQWVGEGRLLPAMMLEEEGSKHRVPAASVGGLEFYTREDPSQPSQPSAVAAIAYEPVPAETVSTDLFLAFGMVAVTLVCAAFRGPFGFLGIFTTLLGITAAVKAKERGSEIGGAAVVVNMIAVAAWIAARVYFSLR